jgi:hypothetical protein
MSLADAGPGRWRGGVDAKWTVGVKTMKTNQPDFERTI